MQKLNVKIRRAIFWLFAGLIVLAGMVFAFKPRAIYVDLAAAEIGTLTVTVSEEGETEVRDVYELSSPIMGRVLRIDVEAGDPVVAAETVVARIEPTDPSFLDLRTEEEARAAVKAANAMLELAKAQLEEAKSEQEFAQAELERAIRLVDRKLISQHELDQAEKNYKTKSASVSTAIAGIRARESELAQAKARLVTPIEIQESTKECKCLSVYAPITGKILRVLHESEGVVKAGDLLVEIGNTADLEIVVDFLSVDAVQIQPGQRVVINEWGGPESIKGIVKKVEPFGYTKTSSLGIDEQRVDVIIDLVDPHEKWQPLGHGYQVDASVILWEQDNVLKLPITALFREGEEWAVFVVEGRKAKLRKIKIGQRNSFEAQIISGIKAGELVILHPSNQIQDNVFVAKREL